MAVRPAAQSPGNVARACAVMLTSSPRPILTPKTVLPLFFTIGIIFAPIGGLLLYASAQVRFTRETLERIV